MSGISSTPEPPVSYATVRAAQAGTGRSSLDLLTLRFPFSQVDLLTASDFASQASSRRSSAARGHSMGVQVLEELHRHGVLIPLFRVDLAPGDLTRRLEIADSLTAQHVHATTISELMFAVSEGRAQDPSVEPFQSWPTNRVRTLWPTYESGYLYSRHQLLGLDVAMSFVELKPKLHDDRRTVTWHFDEEDQLNEPTREALLSWRSLAITLCALDTYYWPFITHTVRHDLAAWRAARQEFDPSSMLAWLGATPEQLTNQADSLRMSGSRRDDTGDFYDLIRRARYEAWDTLRGDALAAMDYRLAADVLDRYRSELAGTNLAPPGMTVPTSQEGLSSPTHSLDAALTGLRLSPFPSLVLGVEGETEERLVKRIMEMLGIELNPGWIRIVDYGGTKKDLTLLARYATEPLLGRDLRSGVALDRPFARFLVLADAENKYATAADRRKQRKALLAALAEKISPDLRGDLYLNSRQARIVEIRTWGKYPFEFAHFTDGQLADGLHALARTPHPGGKHALLAAIHVERLSSSPDITAVGWPGRGRIRKQDLADVTWPLLERRIEQAIARGHQGPPIMKAVLRAYEMASRVYRSNFMLRRYR